MQIIRFRKKPSQGQSLIEMVAALFIIIPVFLCAIDLYFLIVGYWYSASSCRLAARAASQGPPNAISAGTPENRALQVLNTNIADKSFFIHLEDSDVTESLSALPDATLGGAVTGTVTVAISVSITPPFILKNFFRHQKFIDHISETLPYTWVQPGPSQ